MNFSIQWYSGPRIEVIKGEILEGRLLSGKYPKRLLDRIIFCDLTRIADFGGMGVGSIVLGSATPLEIQRLHRDLWRRLVDGDVLTKDIVTGFNGSRSAESMAISLAVFVENSIKLLKKAPRDSNVAKARRTLKEALEF